MEKELQELQEQLTGNADKFKDKNQTDSSHRSSISKIHGIRPLDDSIQLGVSVAYDEITNKIIKKILSIESTVNDITLYLKDIGTLKRQVNENKTNILAHDKQILDLMKQLHEMQQKVNEHDQKMKDFNIKLMDFDIIEELKRVGGGAGGDMNVALNLIQNLENKMMQKLKFIEDRLAKNEEDVIRTKKETTDIKNIADSTSRMVSNLNNKTEQMQKDLFELENKVNDNYSSLSSELKFKYEELLKRINDKINELSTSIDDKLKEIEANTNTDGQVQITDEDKGVSSKHIKDIIKRLSELEKAIKLIPAQLNIEAITKDIAELKMQMNDKSNVTDYIELRAMLTELQKTVNYLKDQIETLIDDQTDHEDIQNLKRRLEALSNKVIELRNKEQVIGDPNGSNSNKPSQIDSSKYIDYNTFNTFKNQVIKEFENVNENLLTHRRLIDELFNLMKSKTSFKDLKTLEDDIMAKLEELKIACSKKFADKIETNKNMKYLDQQLKHIIDVYIKRMEKGDSWLIAKKPLNGHLCASCENYIGDLKESSSYVPWNKYPMRDPNDKLYRIGNGFSKMLQMITVDGMNTTDRRDVNFQTANDFYENAKTMGNMNINNNQHRGDSEGRNLPKISTRKNINRDDDMIGMESGNEMGDEVDPNQPKM